MNIKSIGNKIKGNPRMIEGTVYSMLIICSISHFLNDMIQSIIPSIYPIVKDKFDFSFAQIGIITLVFQMTSSILQPFTGLYADKHPRPYALSIGMCFTLVGLLLLAFAENYFLILLAVSVVGLGTFPYSKAFFKSSFSSIIVMFLMKNFYNNEKSGYLLPKNKTFICILVVS